MEIMADVILPRKMLDPDYRKIQPRAPKQWKRTRPFKEKFVSGFQPVAPSRRSCEWAKDPLYLYEAFENHTRIGQGSFGMVYKVTCKETEEKCAVKISRVNGIYNWKESVEKLLIYEKVSKHENIVKLYNAWIEDDALYTQMELCRKSLLQFILDNVHMEEHHTWNVMIDILEALNYIHSQDFVHLDVKPENILLGFDDRYKLADFDLIHDINISVDHIRAGDDKYRAPEVKEDSFQPHPKNDIFSLGMTLLEMAGDFYLPNGGAQWKQLRRNSFPSSQLKGHVSDTLINVLHLMLRKDIQDRPSAEELLNHEDVYDRKMQRLQILPPESSVVRRFVDHNAMKLQENLEFMQRLEERAEISDIENFIRARSQSPDVLDISAEEVSAPKKLKVIRRLFT
ncbi:membrane-associated tyrosine- and threonine-specific cdc2-inhibitory kinase-like [Planococcus citri]|uniref:membrane-associated tyrosine- and threonine-specific cdc2-inhibitory kinase-like n=1 Tax=Planococcus citri TaxID=170843 RepID=UPI0031F7D844